MLDWVDGQPADQLSLRDRGLAYGDGLFETIAVRKGRMALLERHLARVSAGCLRLHIPLDAALLRHELLAFAAALGEGVAKLILTRGDGLRGYAAPQQPPRRILLGNPPSAWPAAHREQGVRLFACQTRLAHQPLLAGLKHLNRLEQVLARSEWQSADCAEGLMCDQAGNVIEGVFSNLFIVQDQVLYTPALDLCGVAGVMRAEILQRAVAAGIDCRVQTLSQQQLLAADEVFVCNSLYGIWPVVALEARHWQPGPLTRRLQDCIADLLDD